KWCLFVKCGFQHFKKSQFVYFSASNPLCITAMVETQHTWIAEVGENIQLSCQFVDIHGVQEVTWQKVLGSTTRNVSSYNLLAGEKVYPPFKDKVQFAYSGFKNNSITIKNVTEQDVGCYLCLFTAYPLGNVTAETYVNGDVCSLHRSLVTCSATGLPAPTVTLTVYQKTLSFSYYSTRSKINANGTVTVTTTALLSAPSSTLVGCSVEVDFTDPRELIKNHGSQIKLVWIPAHIVVVGN
uniref:Ig-like domain-containing protein n=1 Tax=Poecilia reticulata TaxID=8081 RepID=A0A3P9PAX4_POERE